MEDKLIEETKHLIRISKLIENKIIKMCKNYLIPDWNSKGDNWYWIREVNDTFSDWEHGGFCYNTNVSFDYIIHLPTKTVYKHK